LAEARKRARRAQTAVDDGRDPSGEREAAKAKRTDTVSALVDDYLEKHARKFKRSADEDERILNVEVLPRWGNRSVPREHISFVLNHVDGGSRATQVYDRYSRDDETRLALETWQCRLKAILESKPASTVVPFAQRRLEELAVFLRVPVAAVARFTRLVQIFAGVPEFFRVSGFRDF
jgi:hypothetical protein